MNILWIKTELLHPVDKGGRIRTYHMLRALKHEHRITYLCLDDGDRAPDAEEMAVEYCDKLIRIPFRAHPKYSLGFYSDLARNLFTRQPYAVVRYRSSAMRDAITERVGHGDIDVVVCDFLAPSPNVPTCLPCATILFQHNVEATIWQRHCETKRPGIERRYFRLQWNRMRALEAAETRRYDHVVAVSEADATVMKREYGIASVSTVPTGVDVDYFQPAPHAEREPGHLVFTGSMDWLPNDEGIRHFVERIFPLIRQRIPYARLTVVGRNPTPQLRSLAERDTAITLTGRVADVRPHMARASVYVVPLRVGGGTRLKIYEAMAMGLPVVSTTVGAEGLPLTDGRDLLLVDAPEEFAAVVSRLIVDAAEAEDLGAHGSALVRERFGWRAAAATFAASCETAIARHRS